MIHAFILAAATCTMGASVQAADAQLVKADAAIVQGDHAAAKAFYDAAMTDLNTADWVSNDASCDKAQYTLQRYLTTLHSLSVAVTGGLLPPANAAQHLRIMQDGLYRVLPFSAIEAFSGGYSAFKKAERKYIITVELAAQPQKVAAHEPRGSQCQARDVGAEVLEAVPAYPPDGSGLGDGSQPVVKINVAADGGLTYASIFISTDDIYLDQAALRAVRESTYLPAVKDCVPTAGSLDFTVTFGPIK